MRAGDRVLWNRGKGRTGTVKMIGSCGYGACKNETCVTVHFDDRSSALTENVDMGELVTL